MKNFFKKSAGSFAIAKLLCKAKLLCFAKLQAIIAIAIIAAIGFSITSCGDDSGNGEGSAVAVTGITLNKTTLALDVDDEEKLAFTITPSNAANKKVTWETNRQAVVSVVQSGLVTALSAGSATITVTTEDGNFSATCDVTVTRTISNSEFEAHLASLPNNTPAAPHRVSILINTDGDHQWNEFGNLKYVLNKESNKNKFVYLDLSKGVMPYIPFRAFTTYIEEDESFEGCNTLARIKIPENVEIGHDAFRNCENLASVEIPDSVTVIRGGSFNGCASLTSINLPVRLSEIESNLFENCAKLASINVPNTVTLIGYAAFGNCTSLSSINIPNSVTQIGYAAFKGCTSLASINLLNSVIKLDGEAFSGSGLTSINLPNSITEMGWGTFQGCSNLVSANIPNRVTRIEWGVFHSCSSLTSLTIPDSVTFLAGWGFGNCDSLAAISIGNGLTEIMEGAFGELPKLASITIPATVKKLGKYIFNYSGLARITFAGTIPANDIDPDAFNEHGDLRAKYLAGGPGTYAALNPGEMENEVWIKQ